MFDPQCIESYKYVTSKAEISVSKSPLQPPNLYPKACTGTCTQVHVHTCTSHTYMHHAHMYITHTHASRTQREVRGCSGLGHDGKKLTVKCATM